MNNSAFSLQAYFDRIGYSGGTEPNYETFRNLHIAHTMTVPFENLDIFLGKDIKIDIDSLYNKIVLGKRGGYCFEMNTLFGYVLRQLGFEVHDLLGRVFVNEDTAFALLHHVLLVTIGEKRYLADVGFGGNGLIAPILLEDGTVDKQFNDTFKIVYKPERGYILQFLINNEFRNSYTFTLTPYMPVDYLAPNYFCSHYPESLFTRQKMCTIPTKEGRIIMSDMEFKIRTPGGTERFEAATPDEFNALIKKYFGIEIDSNKFILK